MPRRPKPLEEQIETLFVKVPFKIYWQLEKMISSEKRQIEKFVEKLILDYVEKNRKVD
jgi:molybdopterin-guanine dinucleotide biosynthesis protein A